MHDDSRASVDDAAADRANDPAGSDAAAAGGVAGAPTPPAREAMDIPEWVSEVRRLYVEPKSTAATRENGEARRSRRLSGIRPSRRPAPPVPTPEPAPATVDQGPRPTGLEALAAGAGHSTADSFPPPAPAPEDAAPAPQDAAPATAHRVVPVTNGSAPTPPFERRVPPSWTSEHSEAVLPTDGRVEGAPTDEASPSVEAVATEDAAHDTAHDTADDPADDTDEVRPPRSLAEMLVAAGAPVAPTQQAEPSTPLVPPPPEPTPATAGPPQPPPPRTRDPHTAAVGESAADAQQEGPSATHLAPPVADGAADHPVDQVTDPDVRPTHLSWGADDALDLRIPSADPDDDAIVLEPPSQLVFEARRRPRRRPAQVDEREAAATSALIVEAEREQANREQASREHAAPAPDESPASQAPPGPPEEPALETPATRSAARAADRAEQARRERIRRAVVVTVLVLLAVAVGWFALRGLGVVGAAPAGDRVLTVGLAASGETPGHLAASPAERTARTA